MAEPEFDSELHIAAARGDVVEVRALIDQGHDVNYADAHGFTALIIAAHYGRSEVTRLLLESGAVPPPFIIPPDDLDFPPPRM